MAKGIRRALEEIEGGFNGKYVKALDWTAGTASGLITEMETGPAAPAGVVAVIKEELTRIT